MLLEGHGGVLDVEVAILGELHFLEVETEGEESRCQMQ